MTSELRNQKFLSATPPHFTNRETETRRVVFQSCSVGSLLVFAIASELQLRQGGGSYPKGRRWYRAVPGLEGLKLRERREFQLPAAGGDKPAKSGLTCVAV